MAMALRTAWYRFRVTLGRQWGGYVSIVVLIALVGGLAMGAIAGARRTLASPAVYSASTNPPTFGIGTAVLAPPDLTSGYDPGVVHKIAHLPHVAGVENISGLNLIVLNKDGTPDGQDAQAGNGSGSIDGAYLTKGKAVVVQGRMLDPTNPHEFVANALATDGLGLHVGQVVPFGIYTNAQTQLPGFGTARVPPFRRIDITLVGIILDPTAVAADDVDSHTTLQIFSPALTRQLLSCCANYTVTGVQVRGDQHVVDRVEAEAQRALPSGSPVILSAATAVGVAKAERSVKPLAIALAVFGGIAGLVALIVAGQMIGRQLLVGAEERRILRALGADPAETVLDGLVGVLMGIALGSMLAVAAAIAVSPLAPIGVIRPVYPDRGVATDWTVLGSGFAILLLGLVAITGLLAYRQSPHRVDQRRSRSLRSRSSSANVVAGWGLPIPAVEGVRLALDSGAGRNSVPVRSAILGTALALWVVITTVTFGASLNALVSQPRLYGWNWDNILIAGGGSGNIPGQQATRLLDADPSIAAWTGADFGILAIDGQRVAVMGGTPGASIQPPVLSGQGLEGSGQVVLGPVTLAQLGKHVGDTVEVDEGNGTRTRLRIVGTASMPTIGTSGLHLEMGSGALLADSVLPAATKNPFGDPLPGPQAILVRLKDAGSHRAQASLQRIADATATPSNFGVGLVSVQRPAEIVNYRSMGTTPLLLGVSLGAGAAAALALTLVASVRRRRRNLAVFKTLGFTHRQLAATVAWQSSVSVAIGVVIGVPLGVITGRLLWNLFATEINAVPAPSVPVGWIVAIAVGSLVLANVVAAVPGRIAARTPTALVLRAD